MKHSGDHNSVKRSPIVTTICVFLLFGASEVHNKFQLISLVFVLKKMLRFLSGLYVSLLKYLLLINTENLLIHRWGIQHTVPSERRAPQNWWSSILCGTRLPLGQQGARLRMNFTAEGSHKKASFFWTLSKRGLTLCHSCLKVHGGVPIAEDHFGWWSPRVPRTLQKHAFLCLTWTFLQSLMFIIRHSHCKLCGGQKYPRKQCQTKRKILPSSDRRCCSWRLLKAWMLIFFQ